VDDEYQGVVSQASFAMQGPLEVPIVNAIVSRLHCGSLVIDIYVGATGKYIRRKKSSAPKQISICLGAELPKNTAESRTSYEHLYTKYIP